MSFFFEGSGYFDGSYLINSTVSNTYINGGTITTSSIDMLDNVGNYQNITNVKDPINLQDAATKNYVDNLEIYLNNSCVLTGISPVLISNKQYGSFVVTVSNSINGPTAIFHVTKTAASQYAHVTRTAASPGIGTLTFLQITWNPNQGIYLNKNNSSYDGAYKVKIM